MANREEQLKQITDQLEQGVSEIFTSEKYTEYLQTSNKGSVFGTHVYKEEQI